MSLSKLTKMLFILALFTLSCRESEHGSPPTNAVDAKTSLLNRGDYTPPVIYPVKRYEVALDTLSIAPSVHDTRSPPVGDGSATRSATSESLSSPLSSYAQSTRTIQGLQLKSGYGSHFYTGFPLSVRFGIKVQGEASKMLVNFGLVTAPPKDFPKERYKELHSCSIGSATAVHDGSQSASEEQEFVATLNIPEECLAGKSSARMILTMIFNPDGAVQSETTADPIFVALDKETTDANGLCLKFDEDAKSCQNELLIEKSPGVNIKVTDFTSDSSLIILPYKDPETLFKTTQVMPAPLASTSGSLVLEGAAPLETNLYKARLSYSICAGDGSSDNLTDSCSGPGWQSLSALNSADQTLSQISLSQDVSGFKSEEALNFSSVIHALGSTYKAMSASGKGAWGGETFFRVRACAILLKNDQSVTQVNLDSKAADGDPTADDCMIFPVFKTEETEPTNTHVCGSGDASLDSDGECDTAHEDPSLRVIEPVADYSRSWGGAWGDQDKLRVSFEAGPRLIMSAQKITARVGTGIRTRGYINTDLFAADLDLYLDMTGADQHYLEPSVKAFGAKLYGSRMVMGSDYEYTLPLEKWLGDNGRNKTVSKSIDSRIEKASSEFESPKVVNKGDIHNKPSALFVKELCGGAQVPVYIITVSVDVCGELGAYLGLGAYARVRAPYAEEKTTFPNGKRVAAVGLYFVPAVSASGRGQVSIGIIIAKVGVGGEMRIVEVALPVTLSAKVGNYEHVVRLANGAKKTTQAFRANANFDTSLDLAWLGGRLFVFAEYWGFEWCKAWIFPYPCHFGWRTVDKDIVSFDGGESRFNLIHADILNRSWEPYLATNENACNLVLEKGEEMRAGSRLCSQNGDYTLDFQEDGNLVLYYRAVTPVWASSSTSQAAYRAFMQPDGNFVIYTKEDRPLWDTSTYSSGGTRLVVLNDGRFQILNENNDPVWTTQNHWGTLESGCLPILAGGRTLIRGQSICSPNKAFAMTMESDGNVVVTRSSDRQRIWSTLLPWSDGDHVAMQEDGNFVVYAAGESPRWSTDTYRDGPNYIELLDDGALQLKRLFDAKVLWSSR